jgi:D-threo-aldose 1-dehydrogenase
MRTTRIGETGVDLSELGIGTAPHGGLYSVVTEDMAVGAVHGALEAGYNYIDTAPLYGYGRSELYLSTALADVPRDSYVLSTKVGRVLDPISAEEAGAREEKFFLNAASNDFHWDLSRDGVRRSLQDSLTRLKLDRVDVLYIHMFPEFYDEVLATTYPAVRELKEEGLVRAIGVGVDFVEPLVKFVRDGAEFDLFMLAGRYTLLETSALDELLPMCEKAGVYLTLAGPYNSGILATGPGEEIGPGSKYTYEDASPEIITRARRIKAVCERWGVPLRAAALQFGTAHPAVAATVPGARSREEAQDNAAMIDCSIPKDMWSELKAERLIPNRAPTTQDAK